MGLKRVMRIPPPEPTAAMLRARLKEYGIKRWQCAQIMHVAEITVKRYLSPETSRQRLRIPSLRWEALGRELERLDALVGVTTSG